MSTSPSSDVAAAPRTASDRPLAARIAGVVLHPRETLRAVSDIPHWGGVLVVSALVGVLAGAAVMETDIGKQALVDQWERTAIAFGHDVNDAEYARLEELSNQGAIYAAGMALASGPVVTLAVAALLFAFYGRPRGVQFRQVLAVAAHAGVILALRQLVAAPATYIRETTASATALGVWFPAFDEGSPVARVLASVDLFVVWWAVVLAIGCAVLFEGRARKFTALFVGVYVGFAIVLAAAMALTGGTA